MEDTEARHLLGDTNAVYALINHRMTEREARGFADLIRVIYFSKTQQSKLVAAEEMRSLLDGVIARAELHNFVAQQAVERELRRASFLD